MLIKNQIMLLIMILSIMFSSFALADRDHENAYLARITHVLHSLEGLIHQAEAQRETPARLHFHYEKLRSDIKRIQQGIDEKLNPVFIQPKTIEPITGDYLEYKNK